MQARRRHESERNDHGDVLRASRLPVAGILLLLVSSMSFSRLVTKDLLTPGVWSSGHQRRRGHHHDSHEELLAGVRQEDDHHLRGIQNFEFYSAFRSVIYNTSTRKSTLPDPKRCTFWTCLRSWRDSSTWWGASWRRRCVRGSRCTPRETTPCCKRNWARRCCQWSTGVPTGLWWSTQVSCLLTHSLLVQCVEMEY